MFKPIKGQRKELHQNRKDRCTNITPVDTSCDSQFYPVMVSTEEDGIYTMISPDFPTIQFSAPTLEYGLQSIPELLQNEITGMVYPPVPTPADQITLLPNAFLV